MTGRGLHQQQLAAAYAASGGVLSGNALAAVLAGGLDGGLLESTCPPLSQPTSTVARWIVTRAVVGIDGPAGWLMPRFQFDLSQKRLHADVAAVLAELHQAFDADQTARWFVSSNPCLANEQPVTAMRRDWRAVLQAARTDRYTARDPGGYV